jgi:hypothetical protein
MPTTCCPFIQPDGVPCAAHPLPNSAFCLFHDPDHQQAQAEARSKGGATPRRRTRRFPRLLDHVHVAELLGELFIEALNQTDVSDTKRLQTLTNLSRALLKAVGTPPTFLIHSDRREPDPAAGHLLRLYHSESSDLETPLPAPPPDAPDPAPPLTPTPNPQPPTPECLNAGSQDPALPRARMPELRNDRACLPGEPSLEIGDYDAWWGAVFFCAPDPVPAPLPTPIPSPAPPDPTPHPLGAVPAAPGTPPLVGEGLGERSAEQVREHAMNRARTGFPATEVLQDPRAAAPWSADPDALPCAPAGHGTAEPPLEPLNPRTPVHLTPEQALNRARTGPSSTEKYWDRLLAALSPPPADQPAPDAVPPTPAVATDHAASPNRLNARTPEPLNPEQAGNRPGTGLPGTPASQSGEPGAGDPTITADAPAPPGGSSLAEPSSRPRAGWLAHSPRPTRAVT